MVVHRHNDGIQWGWPHSWLGGLTANGLDYIKEDQE